MRTSASHSSASGHTGRSNGQTEVAAHACASMCDEMVVLWRLAVLDPTMSPQRYSSKLLSPSILCACVYVRADYDDIKSSCPVCEMRLRLIVLVNGCLKSQRTQELNPGLKKTLAFKRVQLVQ